MELENIVKELEMLKQHVKKYHTGIFPAIYLQIHSVMRIQDIQEMILGDVYFVEDSIVKVRAVIDYLDYQISIDAAGRKELAWYALQRLPVLGATEDMLGEWLCLNKNGKQLQVPAYRKMLERTAEELNLKNKYTISYLRSMYGYLAIARGEKTIEGVAREYGVTKYYLVNRIFNGLEIQYFSEVIDIVANIEEEA